MPEQRPAEAPTACRSGPRAVGGALDHRLGGGRLSGKYRADQRPAGDTRLGEDPGRGMEAYDR